MNQKAIKEGIDCPQWINFLNEISSDAPSKFEQLWELADRAMSIPKPSQEDLLLKELGRVNEAIQTLIKRNEQILRQLHIGRISNAATKTSK